MKCWICQTNEANSEEHKFKASDIRRQFGKSFDAVYYDGEKLHPFTSPKDKMIKFPKIICTDCNNNKTRNADDAYTTFFENIDDINYMIESAGHIKYSNIFVKGWKSSKIDLYRYFAKHAGCKIMTSSFINLVDISKLRHFILGHDYIDNFYVKIFFNCITKEFTEQLKINPKDKYRSNIAFGPTMYVGENDDIGFAGSIINGSLRIEWYYCNQNRFNKNIDFSIETDLIEILNVEDYYPQAFTDFQNEDFFSYLNFGKYHIDEELLRNDYRSAFRNLTGRF